MAAHQAPPSLGFSRQEHWSGLPFPSPMHESEKWKLSRVRLFVTPWTVAYQAPPPMGFSRQEYWSGVPLPSVQTPPGTYQIRNSNQQSVSTRPPSDFIYEAERREPSHWACNFAVGETLLWERSPVFTELASSNKSFLQWIFDLDVSFGLTPTERQIQFSGNKIYRGSVFDTEGQCNLCLRLIILKKKKTWKKFSWLKFKSSLCYWLVVWHRTRF